jgi:hypothetical protein
LIAYSIAFFISKSSKEQVGYEGAARRLAPVIAPDPEEASGVGILRQNHVPVQKFPGLAKNSESGFADGVGF